MKFYLATYVLPRENTEHIYFSYIRQYRGEEYDMLPYGAYRLYRAKRVIQTGFNFRYKFYGQVLETKTKHLEPKKREYSFSYRGNLKKV